MKPLLEVASEILNNLLYLPLSEIDELLIYYIYTYLVRAEIQSKTLKSLAQRGSLVF